MERLVPQLRRDAGFAKSRAASRRARRHLAVLHDMHGTGGLALRPERVRQLVHGEARPIRTVPLEVFALS